jgi:hypothetical protein
VDKNNASIHSNSFSLNVMRCGGGVLGPPPVAPEPSILYFLAPDSVNAGESVTLDWEVWDACKVFLDGQEVSPVDTYTYWVPSNEGDTVYTHTLEVWGSSCDNATSKSVQVQVKIVGANNGNNPGGVVGNPPSGNATVRFYNYSSHPIVELLIDGQEVILLHGGRGGLGNDHFKTATNNVNTALTTITFFPCSIFSINYTTHIFFKI